MKRELRFLEERVQKLEEELSGKGMHGYTYCSNCLQIKPKNSVHTCEECLQDYCTGCLPLVQFSVSDDTDTELCGVCRDARDTSN